MLQKTFAALSGALLYSCSLLSQPAQASLSVVNPSSLQDQFPTNEIKSKMSNIGYFSMQKGTTRLGQVISPFKQDGQGCDPFVWDDFTEPELRHFVKTEGFFLLLKRGGCSFMTKVKNAQQFGAEVVIIADYKQEDWADKEKNRFDGKVDGTLTAHIPAFEIAWEDAKKLVTTIREGKSAVYVKAILDVTNDDNQVEVDLWYSTSLDLGLHLTSELAAMSLSFQNDHAHKPLFTLRIASFECMECEEKFKSKHCYSNGAYCGFTPNFFREYDLKHKVSMHGKEILEQAMREKCLHDIMSEKYQDEGDTLWTFFSYLGSCFADTPGLPDDRHKPKTFNECYDWSTVQIKGNEEVDALNKCMADAWVVPNDENSDNRMLRDDRLWAKHNHISIHPSITVNNMTYTNSTGQDLAMSICQAYREAPDECELAWNIVSFGEDDKYEGLVVPHEDSKGLFEKSFKHHEKREGQIIFGSWHMILIVVVILGVNIGVMLYVRHKMKTQMQGQMNDSVNAAVSQYFSLAGSESSRAE